MATALDYFSAQRLSEHNYKPSTLVEYGRALDRLDRSLGGRRVCDLQPRHIDGFLASVPTGSLPSTYSVVAAVFRYLDDRYPGLARLVPARRPRRRRRTRYLTDAEYRRLWAALGEARITRGIWPRSLAAIRLAMLVPLRRSELVSLAWHEVDVPGRRLYLHDTKTGDRCLPLTRVSAAVLLEQRSDHHYVFPGRSGLGHIADTSLGHTFTRICERTGINKPRTPPSRRVSLHTLRHSWASKAIRDGKSMEMVRRMLGHSTAWMAARYVHVGVEELAAIADDFERSIVGTYQLGFPFPIEGGSR